MRLWLLLFVSLVAPRVAAADAATGVTVSFAAYPHLVTHDDDTEETTSTTIDTYTFPSSDEEEQEKSKQSDVRFNLGLGYTMDSGLLLGLKYVKETTRALSETTKTSTNTSTLKYQVTCDFIALGPTLGYVTKVGLTATMTPFLSAGTECISEAEFTSSGSVIASAPEIVDESDNSRISGFLAEIGWHITFGFISFGPQLAFEAINVAVDESQTTRDETAGTTFEVTQTRKGTSRSTEVFPMLGLWAFF